MRARLISTEVSAVKAVSAAATAVPPAASRPLRLPMYKSVSLIVLCCFSQVRYDVDDDTVNYENIRSPDGV